MKKQWKEPQIADLSVKNTFGMDERCWRPKPPYGGGHDILQDIMDALSGIIPSNKPSKPSTPVETNPS